MPCCYCTRHASPTIQPLITRRNSRLRSEPSFAETRESKHFQQRKTDTAGLTLDYQYLQVTSMVLSGTTLMLACDRDTTIRLTFREKEKALSHSIHPSQPAPPHEIVRAKREKKLSRPRRARTLPSASSLSRVTKKKKKCTQTAWRGFNKKIAITLYSRARPAPSPHASSSSRHTSSLICRS